VLSPRTRLLTPAARPWSAPAERSWIASPDGQAPPPRKMMKKNFGGVITRSGSADTSGLLSPGARKARRGGSDHVDLLSEKLRDYKAENQLLGKLLQDAKAEGDRAGEHAAGLKRQLGEARQRAAAAEAQLREAQALASRSVDEAAAARESRERDGQRLAGLQGDLAEARAELNAARREVGALQERLEGAEEARREGAEARARAEATVRESEGRVREVGELRARLREAEERAGELDALKGAWREEWDRVKEAHRAQVTELTLAGQAGERRWREAEARAGEAEARARALEARVGQLEALAGQRERESALTRAAEGDRARDADRQRGTAAAAAARAEQLALANVELTGEVQALTARLRDAEDALAHARGAAAAQAADADAARRRTVAGMLAQAAAGANADAAARVGAPARPHFLGDGPLDTYVRALELALKEALETSDLTKAQLDEARYLEAQARAMLGDSRGKEAEAYRRLQVELRRVHALERMRLSDVAEIADLGRQVHVARQDAYAAREMARSAGAAGGTPLRLPYPPVGAVGQGTPAGAVGASYLD